MTTDLHDLHDTPLPRFEDRLWDELSDLHQQRQRPSVVTAHRPHRRRRPLAIGAAVAVAAATTLVIGIANLPGGKPRLAEASIEERIIAATDAAVADSVVHVVTDFIPSSAGVDQESWIDVTTVANRSRYTSDQGDMIAEYGVAEPPPAGDVAESHPTRVERYVQACDETYTEKAEAVTPMSFPDLEIQDRIASGDLVVEGTEVVDGRELIRLVDVGAAELPADFAVEQRYYVDPESYLPVEIRSDVGGPDENILTFEYLPRTAANLARLVQSVPAGYTEVDQITPC